MIYLLLSFAITYALLSIFVFLGWRSLPYDLVRKSYLPNTKVSIVVAFRNEAENLPRLIKSLLEQEYPKGFFDIILIDDHSEDESLKIIKSYECENLKILRLGEEEKGKKAALQKGIQHSTSELIFTTDADCQVPIRCLRTIVNKYEQSNAKLIAGPIVFFRKSSIFQFFQSLDFIGLQAITGGTFALGKPVMCNGANLAFERKAYLEHCMNSQKTELASGDDVFTLFSLQDKFPNQVFFIKNLGALVATAAPDNFKDFWQQRKRWASKSTNFGKWWITAVLTFVFLFNLLLLVLLFWGIFNYGVFKIFLLGFGIKFFSDALILNVALPFFDRKSLIRFSPLFQIPHMLYTVMIGAASQFSKYRWKGRSY